MAVPAIILALLLTSAAFPVIDSARILVFLPMPAKSHQAVFTPIIRELAVRGHEVVAYVPYELPQPPKTYKEILVPNVMEEIMGKVDLVDMRKMSAVEQVVMLHELGLYIQQKVLEDKSVQELIHSDEKFDVVILESLFVQESFAAFQHKFGAIAVELVSLGSSYWVNEIVGKPHNPSYVIDFKSPYTDKMNFYERFMNTINCYTTSLIGHWGFMTRTEVLMTYYFNYTGWQERPYVTQLLANKSLVLTNSHYSVNYAHPTSPNVIEIGGVHITPNKPLPKDIQAFMDEAEDGVIYFSLGSALKVSDVAKDTVFKAFKESFSKLKQRVLWKWEKEVLPDQPPNVKTSKWFPQRDILAHKNVKLFITHGGFLSVSEAVNCGVPLIGIPFFGDQPKNIKQVASAGYGLKLDFDELTEEKITWAIREILDNPKYSQNAKLRMEMFKDRTMSPLEAAMYWIEYVIKYQGADHLKSAAAFMPLYQIFLLDVWSFILAIAFFFIYLAYKIITRLCRMICGSKKSPKIKQKLGKKKTN